MVLNPSLVLDDGSQGGLGMAQRQLDVPQVCSAHTANRVEDLQGLLHIVILGPNSRVDGSDDVPQSKRLRLRFTQKKNMVAQKSPCWHNSWLCPVTWFQGKGSQRQIW